MYCGLCFNTIDSKHPFTDRKSHKPDCPLYATDKQLIEVIQGKDARGQKDECYYNTNNPEDGN